MNPPFPIAILEDNIIKGIPELMILRNSFTREGKRFSQNFWDTARFLGDQFIDIYMKKTIKELKGEHGGIFQKGHIKSIILSGLSQKVDLIN